MVPTGAQKQYFYVWLILKPLQKKMEAEGTNEKTLDSAHINNAHIKSGYSLHYNKNPAFIGVV